MTELTKEQTEYAVTFLVRVVEARKLSQTQLQQLSSVAQSTISKVLNHTQVPTPEVLRRLFEALGVKLSDILHESGSIGKEIVGYLATPLTAVAQIERREKELGRVIREVREVASNQEFSNPHFSLYWPGDYTHPVRNSEFSPQQVYVMDRSRASGFDFIVLFCADPSYGVGQENEIATQAGLPGIRLVPDNISRMISGSFLMAREVRYSGSLDSRISFEAAALREALRFVKRTYFAHHALYRGMNGNDLGKRLRALIDERYGDYQRFAEELGVDLSYLRSMMDEPFTMANPSARLLRRAAVLLNVSVGYLLCETAEVDPIVVESNAKWHAWVTGSPGLDAATAVLVKDEWMDQYNESLKRPALTSYRDPQRPMQASDWDKLYQKRIKEKKSGVQPRLLA